MKLIRKWNKILLYVYINIKTIQDDDAQLKCKIKFTNNRLLLVNNNTTHDRDRIRKQNFILRLFELNLLDNLNACLCVFISFLLVNCTVLISYLRLRCLVRLSWAFVVQFKCIYWKLCKLNVKNVKFPIMFSTLIVWLMLLK